VEWLNAGRVSLCAPPSANERSLIRHDGAHGVTRPTILDLPYCHQEMV